MDSYTHYKLIQKLALQRLKKLADTYREFASYLMPSAWLCFSGRKEICICRQPNTFGGEFKLKIVHLFVHFFSHEFIVAFNNHLIFASSTERYKYLGHMCGSLGNLFSTICTLSTIKCYENYRYVNRNISLLRKSSAKLTSNWFSKIATQKVSAGHRGKAVNCGRRSVLGLHLMQATSAAVRQSVLSSSALGLNL